MKHVITKIVGLSQYQQSRMYQHDTPKLNKESHEDYEERTWMEKGHYTKDGKVFIPPMAFKNCIAQASKYLSVQIPGKGKEKYTKHFLAGVLVLEPVVLNATKKDVKKYTVFGNSMGRRGAPGARVKKHFPTVEKWEAEVSWHIVDDEITKDIFEKTLKEAGQFIGVGTFRPENGGHYGRFYVESFVWEDLS